MFHHHHNLPLTPTALPASEAAASCLSVPALINCPLFWPLGAAPRGSARQFLFVLTDAALRRPLPSKPLASGLQWEISAQANAKMY